MLLHLHLHAFITQCTHPRVRVRVIQAVTLADSLRTGRAECSSIEYPSKPCTIVSVLGTWPTRHMFHDILGNALSQ